MKRIYQQFISQINNLPPQQLPSLLTALFAALLLTVFPLGLWGDYSQITLSKFVLLAWTCADYGLALLLCLLWLRRRGLAVPWRPCSRPQTLLLLYLLLALVSSLVSALVGGEFVWLEQTRYDGLLTLALLVGVCLSLASLGAWHDFYFDLAAAAALLMALLCLWQLNGGNPLQLYPGELDYFGGGVTYNGRFLGFIGNVDMLSAYWCLLLPLLLGGALLLPGQRRLLPALAAGGGLAVLLLMQVDAGLLAVGLTALAIGPLLLPVAWRARGYGLCALLLLAGLVALYCYNGPAQGTIWELSRLLHGELRDEFGSARVLIWREALSSPCGWREWLLGTGPGTRAEHFSTVFQRYGSNGQLLRAAVDSAHSEYLDDLLEVGLSGLLCYLLALGYSLLAAWRQRGDRRTLMLAAAVLCYSIQAGFNLRSVVVAPLFWLLWGLLLSRVKCKTDA